MNAIGYVRVSTQEQAESRLGLEAQRAAIASWAASRGLEVTIYEDAGITGTSMEKRPALEAALRAATEGAVLVAYSLSRFARSTRDMLIIAERLKRQGADLVSLTESIDTTTATGRLVFTLLSALSQFERDLTSERTKAALGALKARGVRLGSGNPRAGGEATRQRWAAYRAQKHQPLRHYNEQGPSHHVWEYATAKGGSRERRPHTPLAPGPGARVRGRPAL